MRASVYFVFNAANDALNFCAATLAYFDKTFYENFIVLTPLIESRNKAIIT